MPPRPARASEQELRIFEWCDKLVAMHRGNCNEWLFASIVDRAIKDYLVYAYEPNTANDVVRSPHLIHQHASDWIFNNPRIEFTISFEEVCEPLGVNSDGIRKMLRQLDELS